MNDIQKNFKIKTSLSAKLFFYMTVLVIGTITALSLQFYRSFKEFQTAQVQDSIQIQAEKASAAIEGTLENWKTVIAANLPSFRTGEHAFDGNKIRSFVESNKEFLFLDIATTSKKSTDGMTKMISVITDQLSDSRFEGIKPEEAIRKAQSLSYKELNRFSSHQKRENVFVANLSTGTQLPILIMAIKFDVERSDKQIWVLFGAWHTEIIKDLPKSRFIDSYIVDDKGGIFTSSKITHLLGQERVSAKILGMIKQKESQPSGYIEEFKSSDGRRRVGSFSRSPKYKLSIFIEQDVEFAYDETKKNMFSVGLWAVLFILFAIFLSFVGASGITKGLREVTHATQRIAQGDFKYRIEPKTSDEVAQLSHSINQMSEKILNLLRSQIERVRYEKELETAKMVQSTFFPKKDIDGEFSRITGFYTPASECGGDLWAHFRVTRSIEYVLIADAMGHGAPAALVTAMAYSIFMATLDIFKKMDSKLLQPGEILAQLNDIVYQAIGGSISMTAFVGLIDYDKRQITFANAAHNFPLIFSRNAIDDRFKSKKQDISYSTLNVTGTLLGVEPNQKFMQKSFEIRPGDRIVLYTDGLIECRNPQGQPWGKRKLVESALSCFNQNAVQIKENIVKSAFDFYSSKPLDDDTTLVIVEILDTLEQYQPEKADFHDKISQDLNQNSVPLPSQLDHQDFEILTTPQLTQSTDIVHEQVQGPTKVHENPSASAERQQFSSSTHTLLSKLRARRQKVS